MSIEPTIALFAGLAIGGATVAAVLITLDILVSSLRLGRETVLRARSRPVAREDSARASGGLAGWAQMQAAGLAGRRTR